MIFELLKTLFPGKICSENTNNNNSGIINNGSLTVTLIAPEEEDKRLALSPEEKEILFALAEGADIAAIRNEDGNFVEAVAYGNAKAASLPQGIVIANLGNMLRKGLLDRTDDTHFRISEVGRRIVISLDINQ